MSIRVDVRYQTDIVVTEEEGIERAIKTLRRSSQVLLKELKKRRRDGPKPGIKRRNKRWFAPQTRACVMASGERWTLRSRSYRPPPFEPE